MIRRADWFDIEALIDLGRAFHQESAFAAITRYCDASMKATLASLISDPDAAVFVLERDGKVVGAAGAEKQPLYFNKRETMATVLFWYVLPDHRNSRESLGLLDAIDAWAKERGYAILHAGVTATSPPGMRSAYARRGMVYIQSSFMKRI